jgi:hypothetical protein
MYMSKRVLMLLATAFFTSASYADIGDGKWLVEACSLDSLKKLEQENKDKYLSQLAYCNAYVMGIIHGHYATRAAYKRELLFCLPQGRSNF